MVVQARRKQVQFFDHAYDASRISSRYLSQFPTTLKEGEVTGEASPGYAQYSQVPGRVARHLAGVRILVIARDPAERAHSSYHYNYVGSARVPLPFEMLVEAEISFLEAFFRDGPTKSVEIKFVGTSRTTATGQEALKVKRELLRGATPASRRENASRRTQKLPTPRRKALGARPSPCPYRA